MVVVLSVLDNEDGDGSASHSVLAAGWEHQKIIHNQINNLHFNKARQGKALPRNCQNSQALSCSFQFVLTGTATADRLGGDC